jgi:hypothetical protein
MTYEQLLEIKKHLGWPWPKLAKHVGLKDDRMFYHYKNGTCPIEGPIAMALKFLVIVHDTGNLPKPKAKKEVLDL